MVPQHLRAFFWDTNLDNFDPVSYPQHTIARVLEFGNEAAVVWLRETFSEEMIKRVISNERRLSRKSANFWALAYGIPSGQVAALKADR